MNSKEISAQIYLLDKTDQTLFNLKLLALVKDKNLTEIIDYYEKIVNGSISLVNIFTNCVISSDKKLKLEKYLVEKFQLKDYVFVYTIDKDQIGIKIILKDMEWSLTQNIDKFI